MGDYISKESYEKLKERIEELKKKRAKISKAIGEAREHGDLKENSAYHAAKEEQGLNEMKIKDLESQLAGATIVDAQALPKKDTATLGSIVRIRALDGGREFEYALVSDMEADIMENKISVDSPIGGALFDRKAGDEVEVEAPRGLVKYKILEIK